MPTAFNKETGELKILDDSGQWVKPKEAVNPQTKQRVYHDGTDWKPVPLDKYEYIGGLGASTLQGPLLGFGDEFVSGLENPAYALASAGAAYSGIPQEVVDRNQPEGAKGYKESLERFRGIESRFREENPNTAMFATMAGGAVGGGLQLGRGAFNAARAVLPNASNLTRAAATGSAFGATAGFGSGEGSGAERLVSSVFGAAAGAGVGATFEAAAPAVAQVWRSIRGNPALFNETTGQFTAEGQRAAQEAGLDPAAMGANLRREFGTEARNALNPEQAGAVANARTLPVPVNLRQGQATLNPDQQMFESQAAKGVYGDLAGDTMRGSNEAQQAALRGNVDAIRGQLGPSGGAPGVEQLGQGVQRAQSALSGFERQAKTAVNNLYTRARDANGQASILGRNVAEGVFGIKQSLDQQGLSSRVAGRVHGIIDDVARGMQSVGQQIGKEPRIQINNLFDIRRELSALGGSSDAMEAKAAQVAKRSLDSWLSRAVDDSLIEGDPAVIGLWRDAIRARRQYGQVFQGGDLVESLTARVPGQANQLKLDANGAVNVIFGRSEVGWTTRSGLARDLTKLRQVLGPDSPEWRNLREEAFLRMSRAGEGVSTPTGRDFSGAKFAKAWEDAQAKSPEVIQTLFDRRERALISQFAQVARRVTTPVSGGSNASNTSAGMAQMVRRLWLSSFMGPKMAAFLEGVPFIRGMSNVAQEMRAQRALTARLQERAAPVPQANYGIPAAVAGVEGRRN